MTTTIVKPNITNDLLPAPCDIAGPSAVPPGYRLFNVASFVAAGGFAGQITVEGQVLSPTGKPVRGATYDASLFLFINGIWRLAGRPVIGASGGEGPQAPLGSGRGYKSARFISFLFGGMIDVATDGFLWITNIQSPVEIAGSMIFNIQGAVPATSAPRTLSGTTEVTLAAPATWKTLPVFVNTGASNQPLVASPTPVEQYVLIQSDPGNPIRGRVEIGDSNFAWGDGFVITRGESIQWPTRDASSITITTDHAPGAITIRSTRF